MKRNFHIKLGKLLAVLALLCIAPAAWGATYCVKPDGAVAFAGRAAAVVASAAACTAVQDANAALSVTAANNAGFSAGDVLYYSGKNATSPFADADYSATAIAPGKAGASYLGIADSAGGLYPRTTHNSGISPNGAQSGTTISGFRISPSDGANKIGIGLWAVYTNLTLSNLTVNMAAVTGTTDGIYGSANANNGMSISGFAISGHSRVGIYFLGNAQTGLTISDGSIAGGTIGIQIRYPNGLVIRNVPITGTSNASYAAYIYDGIAGGLLTIDNLDSDGSNAGVALYISNCNFSILSTIKNLNYSSNAKPSLQLRGVQNLTISDSIFEALFGASVSGIFADATGGTSANITLDNVISLGPGPGGFYFTDTANAVVNDSTVVGVSGHAIEWTGTSTGSAKRCKVLRCGTKSITSTGVAFVFHNSVNIIIDDCIAAYNTTSAVAALETSTGSIINCSFYKNGGKWSTSGGSDSVRAGMYQQTTSVAGWVYKNNIISQNWPYQVYSDGTATFANNLYESDTTTPETAEFYYSSNGRNFAYWLANIEATAKNASPQWVSVPLSSASTLNATDFLLADSSPASGAGILVDGVHNLPSSAKYNDGTDVTFGPNVGAMPTVGTPTWANLNGAKLLRANQAVTITGDHSTETPDFSDAINAGQLTVISPAGFELGGIVGGANVTIIGSGKPLITGPITLGNDVKMHGFEFMRQ